MEIDEAISNLTTENNAARDQSIPVRKLRNLGEKLTRSTLNLIRGRNKLRRQWRRCTDSIIKRQMKTILNKLNREINTKVNAGVNRNFLKKFEKPGSESNKLWSIVKQMKSVSSRNIPFVINNKQSRQRKRPKRSQFNLKELTN